MKVTVSWKMDLTMSCMEQVQNLHDGHVMRRNVKVGINRVLEVEITGVV